MKKILISLIICLIIISKFDLVLATGVEKYVNESGAIINSKKMNVLKEEFSNEKIENMDQIQIDAYSELLLSNNKKSVYSITTYKLDKFGNIVDQYTMDATEEEAKQVAKDDTLRVSPDKTLVQTNLNEYSTAGYVENYYYETESKRVTGSSEKYGDTYVIQLWASWYKTPKIKEFDIMAVRWDNSVSISNIIGWQDCDSNTGITNYSMSSSNTKYTNYGAGISMNIHDSAKDRIELYLRVESNNYFGYDFYGTYQHARHSNANTLSISQSYTFGNGLGGVLVFSNSTYRSYYDDMAGIKYHFE